MPNAPTKHTKRQDYALIKERIESLNRDSEKFLTIDTEKSLSLATDALNLSLAIQEAQAEARSRLNIGYACFRLCKSVSRWLTFNRRNRFGRRLAI
jgi:hypothetical protein